ncbi:MAG: plasmid pRiA4b ORF-3 family protein [Candidatus Nanopelagicales bacterium]
MIPEDPDSDLRRRFDSLVAGLGLDDLGALAHVIPLRGDPPPRPELRRLSLPGRHVFRVRVDLDDSDPVIWRRLDLRSDLPLNVVHQAIQSAFGWWDYHLNRFTLGGGPWDRHSQVFACREDLQEGEVEDEAILDSLVRLDETLQEPGDVLHYAYDYGDSWELTIRLEEVLPFQPGAALAGCLAGERAAPPEDCGHLLTEAELAEVLDDPAAFDLGGINAALTQPYFALVDLGVSPALVDLVNRLRLTEVGEDVTARAVDLGLPRREPTGEEWSPALRAYQWFLDRAAGDGIALTAAGYLKPADVVAVAPLVPTVPDWYGKNNRESMLHPLLDFRQSLQRLGLLRKSKGRLLLTKAGRSARGDVAALREHLADRLARIDDDPWTAQATLLILLYAATSADAELPLESVAAALREFGWKTHTGPVRAHHLYGVAALDVLLNVSERPADFGDRLRISAPAAALARRALAHR